MGLGIVILVGDLLAAAAAGQHRAQIAGVAEEFVQLFCRDTQGIPAVPGAVIPAASLEFRGLHPAAGFRRPLLQQGDGVVKGRGLQRQIRPPDQLPVPGILLRLRSVRRGSILHAVIQRHAVGRLRCHIGHLIRCGAVRTFRSAAGEQQSQAQQQAKQSVHPFHFFSLLKALVSGQTAEAGEMFPYAGQLFL